MKLRDLFAAPPPPVPASELPIQTRITATGRAFLCYAVQAHNGTEWVTVELASSASDAEDRLAQVRRLIRKGDFSV